METAEVVVAPVEAAGEFAPKSSRASHQFKRCLWGAIVLCFLLLAYDSVTRLRQFSPDSKYYIEAARHLVRGEGYSRSTFNIRDALRVDNLSVPQPTTVWMPLYPMLIAAAHALGAPAPEAALVVSVFSSAMLVLILYAIARRLYGEKMALLTATYLSASGILLHISTYAWSETTSIAFLALAFYLVTVDRQTGTRRYWIPIAAGVAACLSFYTRYAMLPMAGVVGVLLAEPKDWRATLRNWLLFGGAYALMAAPYLVRNAIVSGRALGGVSSPSEQGVLTNSLTLYMGFASSILPETVIPPTLQFVVVTLAALALAGRAFSSRIRAKIRRCFRCAFVSEHRYVLTAWAAAYCAYMVVYRSFVHLDPLDSRLGAPGLLPLSVALLAFTVYWFGLEWRGQRRLANVFVMLALAAVIKPLFAAPVDDYNQRIASSERMSWIIGETTPRDLIIGDDLTDLTFLYPGRPVLIVPVAQGADLNLKSEDLYAAMKKHGDQYDRTFLVLSKRWLSPPAHEKNRTEEKAKQYLHERLMKTRGPFLTDIIEGRTAPYPEIKYLREVKDGYIFSMECPEKIRP